MVASVATGVMEAAAGKEKSDDGKSTREVDEVRARSMVAQPRLPLARFAAPIPPLYTRGGLLEWRKEEPLEDR